MCMYMYMYIVYQQKYLFLMIIVHNIIHFLFPPHNTALEMSQLHVTRVKREFKEIVTSEEVSRVIYIIHVYTNNDRV